MLIETGGVLNATMAVEELEMLFARQSLDSELREMPFDELVPKALKVINGLRTDLLGMDPIEELPRNCNRLNWRNCLVGKCFGDVPFLAEVTCAADPYVGELERRFEARQLPEYEAPTVYKPNRVLSW